MISLAGAIVDDHNGPTGGALACAVLIALAVPLGRGP